MKYVLAGAAFLDSVRPGWQKGINLTTLNLGCGRNCIVAQLFGSYEVGCRAWGIRAQSTEATQLGFNADDKEGDTALTFVELTAQWRELIENRLEVFAPPAHTVLAPQEEPELVLA